MKKHSIVLLMILSVVSIGVSGQEKNEWEKGISVGRSSDNKFTRSLPAQFIATYPSNADNSYSINGFMSVNLYKGAKKHPDTKFSLIYELHKNTLISKKQNLYQFGLSFAQMFDLGKINPLHVSLDLSLRYSKDKVENKKGGQYLGYVSFHWQDNYRCDFFNYFIPGRIYKPNRRSNIDTTGLTSEEIAEELKKARKIDWKNLYFSDFIQLEHGHAFGLEHVNYENLTLFNASFNIDVYPFSGFLYSAFGKYQILKLYYAISYRNNLNDYTGSLFVGDFIRQGVSLNYTFDKEGNTSLSFGYEYSKGGNPLKGLQDTKFGQLTIGTKINLL